MAWGKTEEQKQAERLQREEEERRRAAAKQAREAEEQRQAYLASPAGRAQTAFDRGDSIFHHQATTALLTGYPSEFGSSENSITYYNEHLTEQVSGIEAAGWRLDHVGYTFVETGSTSTNRMLQSGEGTVNQGSVLAIYLFRRAA